MIQQEFRLVRKLSGIESRALSIASLSALFCACSSDVVNMGDDADESPAPALPAHSLCLERTTLSGDFVARSQADIDALEGCEAIEGNLLVQPYFDPDLRPLHALTTVNGELGLGSSHVWSPDEPTPEQRAAMTAALESGFLQSLGGPREPGERWFDGYPARVNVQPRATRKSSGNFRSLGFGRM